MLYKGPLYAKVAGKYVPVEHDAQYYDQLEALLKHAAKQLNDCYRIIHGNSLTIKDAEPELYKWLQEEQNGSL